MDRRCGPSIRLMNSVSKQGIHKYGDANCERKTFRTTFDLQVKYEWIWAIVDAFIGISLYMLNCTALLASEMVEKCNAAVSWWISRWLIHLKLNRGTLGFVYDPYRRFTCQRMLRKKKRKIDEGNRDWGEGTNVGVSSRPWTLRFRVVPIEIHASPVTATAVRWRTLAKLFRNMYKVIVNTRHARYTWSHYTPENDTEHVAPIRSFSYSVPFVWNGGENGAAAISRETFTSARTRAVRVAVIPRI